MSNQLILIRDTYSDNGTVGKFFIDGEFFCHTIERPWKNNESGVSCIPTGNYPLRLRYSPIIKRTTGGEFSEGYEVTDVPNRTYIMLHIANTSDNVRGCIGCGDSRGEIDGLPAVLNSKTTFRKLMERLDEHSEWEIIVSSLNYGDGLYD